jgi:hypothetical protein
VNTTAKATVDTTPDFTNPLQSEVTITVTAPFCRFESCFRDAFRAAVDNLRDAFAQAGPPQFVYCEADCRVRDALGTTVLAYAGVTLIDNPDGTCYVAGFLDDRALPRINPECARSEVRGNVLYGLDAEGRVLFTVAIAPEQGGAL